MTIIIAAKEVIAGTASPTALSQPTTVIDLGAEADEYIIEGYIDLSRMNSGDRVSLQESLIINGASRVTLTDASFAGALPEPAIRFHSKTMKRDAKYRVTLTQWDGTLKDYPYFFIKLRFGVL